MTLAAVTIEVDAGALLILPLILLIGWFASRMLGVRQTWFRTFVTGFFGWVLGVLIAGVSVEPHASTSEILLRVIPFSVLATMAIAIALDFIAKPGAKDPYERLGRLPQVPHPVRRVQRTAAPPMRFRQVLSVARQEGLLHRRFASAAGIADPEFGPRLRVDARGVRGNVHQARPGRVDAQRPASGAGDHGADPAPELGACQRTRTPSAGSSRRSSAARSRRCSRPSTGRRSPPHRSARSTERPSCPARSSS